jgi:hypothetical protein
VALVADVAAALRSRNDDVRAAALKAMAGSSALSLSAAEGGGADVADVAAAGAGAAAGAPPPGALPALRALLVAHAPHEPRPKTLRHLFQLLSLLPCAGGGAGDNAAAFALALRAARAPGDPDRRRFAVACLGPLAAALQAAPVDALPSTARRAAAADAAAVADACSAPTEFSELRAAAVALLASSGLLAPPGLPPREALAGGPSGQSSSEISEEISEEMICGEVELCVRAWATEVRLMEDEDPEVREAAGGAAADALARLAPRTAAAQEAPAAPDLRQCGVEAVKREVFPALAARLGPSPALLAQLRAWVCDPGAAAAEAGAALGAAGAEGAAGAQGAQGRLFDREANNTYEEPLFVAQVRAGTIPAGEFMPKWDEGSGMSSRARVMASGLGCATVSFFGGQRGFVFSCFSPPLPLPTQAVRSAPCDCARAQLAAGALARLLPQLSPASGEARRALEWAATAAGALHALLALPAWATTPERAGPEADHPAGQPAVFAPLCALWLAVWAAGHLPGGLEGAADVRASLARLPAAALAVAAAGAPQLGGAAGAALAAWGCAAGAAACGAPPAWDPVAFLVE